ncbi:MAG: MFS transporter [Pseudomonadota bacterium]
MSDNVVRGSGGLLFAVVLLDMVGFGIVIPILPFISPQLGASDFDIALIIASYSLCAGVVGPWWGRMSDRYGRKPILMVCTTGGALAYAGLALADQIHLIYLARIFAGLVAGNFAVASAIMADLTPPAERARGMGVIGAAFGTGLVLGPFLGGLLSTADGGFTVPCFLAAGMSLLAVLSAWVFLPESHPPEARQRSRVAAPQESLFLLLKRYRSRLILFQFLLHTSCVSASTYLFPLWVGTYLNWGAREVGIVFGVQGAIMALTQGLLMSSLVRVLGEVRLLRICVTFFFLGFALAIFSTTSVPMVTSVLIALTGATLCMPVLNSITSQRSAVEHMGKVMGAASSAAAWGRVLGPVLAGLMLTHFGFSAAWFVFTTFIALYGCWAFSNAPLWRRDTQH